MERENGLITLKRRVFKTEGGRGGHAPVFAPVFACIKHKKDKVAALHPVAAHFFLGCCL